MNHYSLREWSDYKERAIDNIKMVSMEDHLLHCDTCSEIYLSLFDDEIVIKDSLELSSDFADNVMGIIHENNLKINRIKHKNALNNMMIYYAAAACLTLFLTSQGVFNYFYEVAKVPINGTKASSSKNTVFIQSGWTDRLGTAASSFLDNLINDKGDY